MLALFLNILLLFIGVGGAIVSSLTLSNAAWRVRAVAIFGIMGLVGFLLTIVTYKNLELTDISDAVSDAATTFMTFARNHSWFWPVSLLLIGLGFGTCFGIYISKFSNRKRFDASPRVSKWLDALDAIKKFADSKLTAEWKRIRDQVPRLNSQIDSAKRLLEERKQATFVKEGDGLDMLARNAEIGSLAAQHREAIDSLNKVAEEVWKKETEVLADIIAQLKCGTLVGKGFRHRLNRVADSAEIIPLDHWQLLNFETYDQKRQTVEGGGKKYVGLRIGRNDNPPP